MFDPNLPQATTEIDAVEMRGQLNALNDDIQTRSTVTLMNATVANAVSTTSANCNSVGTLGMSADSSYSQGQHPGCHEQAGRTHRRAKAVGF
jgi:hypothetical protein